MDTQPEGQVGQTQQTQQTEEARTVPRPLIVIQGEKYIYAFRPKEDIKSSELAHCLELIILSFNEIPGGQFDAVFLNCRPSTKRHFLIKEVPRIIKPGPMSIVPGPNGKQ